MTRMKRKILVLGTRSYSLVLMDMFEVCEEFEFVGAVENMNRERCDERLDDLPIYWTDDIGEFVDSHELVCALGTTLRDRWIEECKSVGFRFASLFHPSIVMSKRTSAGTGVIVDAGCVLAGYSEIQDHVRIGRRASIGHHTVIGAYSTVHPGAIVSGYCTIGRQVTIGSGAVVIDGRTIGDGAVIAAGAIVNRDVPPGVMVAGNPAQVKRTDYGPV